MVITVLRHEDGVRKWVMFAWIFGSGMAAFVSLLQGMEAKKDNLQKSDTTSVR
jgi:hypothetical protein